MPAGVEDGRVVAEIHVLQGDRLLQLGHGGERGGDPVGALLPAVDLGGEAALVDRGDDTAGCGDDDLVTGRAERLVGRDGLLGPEAGGVLGAVGERPVVGAGHHEEDLGHGGAPGV